MALNKTVTNAITDSAINTDKIADGTLIADDFAGSTINVSKTSLGVSEPTISSFTPSTLTVTSGGAVTINGAGFISIPTVRFVNQSTGAVVEASAVSFTSVTQISATMPASQTEGTYKFVVENSNGLSVQSSTAITYSDGPTWTTSAGSLGSFVEESAVSVTVAATDGSETVDTFAITSGSLPSGLSLNTSTGVISGTAAAVGSDTTSNFTIRATDDEGQTADRAFAITITDFAMTNSLRMNAGDNSYLSRTKGTSTSTKIGTYSFWFKLSTDAGGVNFLNGGTSSTDYAITYISSSETLKLFAKISNSTVLSLETNRTFRDTAAWYHCVIAIDTTQAASSDRVKLYINGTQETSFASSTYPGQNDDLRFFTSSEAEVIGRDQTNGESTVNGYLAEFVKIDGTQLTPTSFGETNSDGVWVPKGISGVTFGTNGFHLKFTNSGALGTDSSGNSNTFTLNSIASTDQATDTPLNNACTIINASAATKTYTLTEGATKITASSSNWHGVPRGSIGVSSGKWYYEIKITDENNNFMAGYMSADNLAEVGDVATNGFPKLNGFQSSGYIKRQDGSEVDISGSYQWNDGDIAQIALDMDNNKLWIGKAGSYYNSGDPAAGSNETIGSSYFTSGEPYLPALIFYGTNDGSFNFGSPAYSITSSQSDANGYGNFEYTVPSGFFALNTKNLAQYG